jgi:outer membrane immunogenic protein
MRHMAMKVVSAAALSLGLTVAASAADLRPAYKAPAPVAAPYNYSWSGFYIGGHAGVGWSEGDDSGFVGGGQIGYNWQFAPNWVIGIEGDFSGTSLSSGGGASVAGVTVTGGADLNWLASVRGRLGYTWDHFMLYFTGGGAWADVSGGGTVSVAGLGSAAWSASGTASGWVLGGGGEWMFAPNWTFGVEYLHYEFDNINGSVSVPGFTVSGNFGTDGSVDVVRARLNYKFGDWFGKGAPVAARY